MKSKLNLFVKVGPENGITPDRILKIIPVYDLKSLNVSKIAKKIKDTDWQYDLAMFSPYQNRIICAPSVHHLCLICASSVQ